MQYYLFLFIQKNDLKRKEKILKELEKKYEIEKNKIAKLEANLNSTEEELKTTKKVTYRFCLMRFALRRYSIANPWMC